jgi:hypothetical protein
MLDVRTFPDVLAISAIELDVFSPACSPRSSTLVRTANVAAGAQRPDVICSPNGAINLPWISSHALCAVPCAASKPPCTGFKGTYHIAGHLLLS